MSERPTVVETHDLTKKYGDMFAIRSIDLQLDEGDLFGFIGIFRQLNATTFTATAGVDLRFYHYRSAAQLFGDFSGFLRGKSNLSVRHWYIKFSQDFLCLILVYFHYTS